MSIEFQSLLIFIVATYPIELVSALNVSIPLFPYYCTYVSHWIWFPAAVLLFFVMLII